MPATDAVAALTVLIERAKRAGPQIAFEGALLVEGFAKKHASGPHGPTTLGVISGRLRASIRARTAVEIRPNVWQSKTFPTVVYARIQELGGHIYPKHLTASGRLGYLSWMDGGQRIFAQHVYIPPRPYLRPGRDDAKAPYRLLVRNRIAEALGVD